MFRGSEAEAPGVRRGELENILLLFFGTHGEKCGGDDHSEKDQCKDKIVDHWGSLLFLAALAVFE